MRSIKFIMEDADSIHSMESSVESEPDQDDLNLVMTKESKHKPGIIYLSRVPSGYNVSQTTQFFSEFGRYLTYQSPLYPHLIGHVWKILYKTLVYTTF